MRKGRNEKNISKLLMRTSKSTSNIFSKKRPNLKDFNVFSQYVDRQLSYYNLDPRELGSTKSIFNKTGISWI